MILQFKSSMDLMENPLVKASTLLFALLLVLALLAILLADGLLTALLLLLVELSAGLLVALVGCVG